MFNRCFALEFDMTFFVHVQALPFIGFSVAMFLFYSLVPILLKVWLGSIKGLCI